MKRISKAILLSIVALLIASLPVLAAVAYRAPYTIIESTGNAYGMLPVIEDVDNTWLADNGFMTASALDTRIETLGGLEKPHLVVDDKTLTSVVVPANSQTNLYLTTANSTLSSMDIITGYQGKITVSDDADLELGDTFEIEIDDAYINTDAGGTKNLVFKQDAFKIYMSAAGVTAFAGAGVLTIRPNAAGDFAQWTPSAGANWENVDDISPDEDATYVSANAGAKLDTYNIPDPTPSGTISYVKIYGRFKEIGGENEIKFVVRKAGASSLSDAVVLTTSYVDYSYQWNLSPFTSVVWTWAEIDALQIGMQVFALGGGSIRGTQLWAEVATLTAEVTAINVSTGEHDIKVTADGVNLEISIDGAVAGDGYDTVGLGGASVPDNGNDWLIMDNSTTDFMSYMGYYKHTVGGVLKAWYQPNAIVVNTSYDGTADAGSDADTIIDAELTQVDDYWIGALVTITAAGGAAPEGETSVVTAFAAGTDEVTVSPAFSVAVASGDTYTIEFGTLVDRQGGDEDARITWGVNPTGVAVTLGGMVSEGQPVPGVEIEAESRDVMPAIGVSDWYVEPDVSGSLLINPLRPFVTMLSDNSNITEILAWRLYASALLLMVTVGTAYAVRGHQGITVMTTSAAMLGLVALTIYPMWTLVLVIIMFMGGLAMERSQSL